jgi:hypothetical protein
MHRVSTWTFAASSLQLAPRRTLSYAPGSRPQRAQLMATEGREWMLGDRWAVAGRFDGANVLIQTVIWNGP